MERIFTVNSKTELERCYPIMKELRPHLSFQEYSSIYDESHAVNGYQMVAIEIDGNIAAVMGYRFLTDYVRGKHVYIDDLVTSESSRSKGLGRQLLSFAENVAKQNGCKSIRLCTGIENLRGMSFYERNGWAKRAVAYTKKISS